jgi:hypothetical protein
LCLLFLAKDARAITNESYEAACREFAQVFPGYRPGLGIQRFLSSNWTSL